jgi:phage gp29-like protein
MKNDGFDGQFATRARAGELTGYFALLPDPDPVLRKKGIDVSALRPLLADPHLESVASVRVAAVSSTPWHLVAGAENDVAAEKALALAAESFAAMDIPGVIEEAMEAVFYGYKPLEVLWDTTGGRWIPSDIIGKPSEWFSFDQDNVLVFKGKLAGGSQELPPYRFVCARHRASYDNPYGQKAFSKCFWPVTFKRAGWQWWTTFVEKYGGLIALGKYPKADEAERGRLLEFLECMIADAVGAVPEGTEVEFKEAADKAESSQVYTDYLAAADNEVSKAILGQTLTTQIGTNGSYAAAQVHDMVRKDLCAADKRRVENVFNQILQWIAVLNCGEGTPAPRFAFDEPENLKKDKAERDKLLFDMGVRFSKGRIASEYGIPEDGFEVTDPSQSAGQSAAGGLPFARRGRSPAVAPGQMGVGKLLRAIFSGDSPKKTPEEKQTASRLALAENFARLEQERFARAVETNIQAIVDRIGTAKDYGEIVDIVSAAYPELNFDEVVSVLENVRYAADQLAATNEKA